MSGSGHSTRRPLAPARLALYGRFDLNGASSTPKVLSADTRGHTAKSTLMRFQWSLRTGRDTTAPDSTLALGASRNRRAGIFSMLVVAVYAVLGILAYWPVLPGDPHRLYGQANGDPAQTVWFFAWTAHAVVTGHNPLFTMAVNVPSGLNLAQQAGIPLLGLLALPITLIVGPVASATTFMVAAMPLSAACAYAVLRRWQVWAPAAALGGLAYGFSLT